MENLSTLETQLSNLFAPHVVLRCPDVVMYTDAFRDDRRVWIVMNIAYRIGYGYVYDLVEDSKGRDALRIQHPHLDGALRSEQLYIGAKIKLAAQVPEIVSLPKHLPPMSVELYASAARGLQTGVVRNVRMLAKNVGAVLVSVLDDEARRHYVLSPMRPTNLSEAAREYNTPGREFFDFADVVISREATSMNGHVTMTDNWLKDRAQRVISLGPRDTDDMYRIRP